MKRLFTLVICFTLSQFTKADPLKNLFPADTGGVVGSISQTLSAQQPKRDTTLVPVINPLPLTAYQNNVVKLRLDSIQKEVPLNYNEYVQSYIDLYTAPHRRDDIGRILGLAKYYFPIYEKAFHDMGIPQEIKFLSIVESELNPNAVSRVGATGPWQFMYTTAKDYGLNIDNFVDERRDPIQASYAAAAYLKDAYMEFGDWLLAIASYNCGKSNVERAIDKAGVNDFWACRQYLPAETRGYVPAYIAIAYVMNYFYKHGITQQPCSFAIKNDTVLVNKMVSLNNIAGILEVPVQHLALLNPSYKRLMINGSVAAPRRLVLPEVANEKYGALYEALNTDAAFSDAPPAFVSVVADKRAVNRPAFHKVKRGETVADISDRFGVEEEDLKAWNHLHSDKPAVGESLRLSAPKHQDEEVAVKSKTGSASRFIFYKVRPGDTLSAIADKFNGTSVESIRSLNGLKKGALQPGMKLKISRG